MSAKQAKEINKGISKETIFKEIVLQLTQALPALKESLGEKKFEKRIKKAAKLLSEGIKSADQKKKPVAKSVLGKTKQSNTKVPTAAKKAGKTPPKK
ncbi:MAG: hypothetical protein ABI707_03650 [Ferruginibacter sp.]